VIPRSIHQVWIGPRPAPLQWTRSWAQVNPDFTYRLWDDDAIEEFGLVNHVVYQRFMRAQIYDGAADVARAEILHRHGGVYVDADSIALRPLEGAPFMEAGFFAQREPSDLREDLITNAFMGAIPAHPVLDRYIDVLSRVRELRPMWRVSGPGALTDVLAGHQEADVMILPSWTFFTASLEGDEQLGGDSYAQHFWSTTAERWGREHATTYPTAGAPSS
jgi:mannosyltransferase OCH1-like enzyme